jgi:hypothetical protein
MEGFYPNNCVPDVVAFEILYQPEKEYCITCCSGTVSICLRQYLGCDNPSQSETLFRTLISYIFHELVLL